MVAQPQCQAVGGAAQLLHFRLGQRAAGHRQAGAFAGQTRGAGLEGDLDVRGVRERAHGAGGGAFEILGPGGVFGLGHGVRRVKVRRRGGYGPPTQAGDTSPGPDY